MKKLMLWMVCAISAGSCRAAEMPAFERSRASYSNQLAQVDGDCMATRRKIAATYTATLKQLADTYRARGHLEALLATQKEAQRFGESGTISASDVVREPAQLARLQGQCRSALDTASAARNKSRSDLLTAYVRHLQELQKTLTVKGEFEEAFKVKGLLDELKASKPDAAAAPAPGSGATASRRGPVAHYDFEDGAAPAVKDRSGNGKEAKLLGGSIEALSGKRGNVLLLDGLDDGLDTPLRVGDLPVTIALWLRRAEKAGPGSYGYVFGFHPQKGRRFYLGIGFGTGDLGLGLGDSTMQREGYGLPRDLEWHHCVVTYDPPVMTLFFDGVEIASKSGEQAVDGTLTFGCGRHYRAEGEPTQFIAGMMDDIMVFDRVLAEGDVRRLFTATGGTPARVAAVEQARRNRKPDDGSLVYLGNRYKLFKADCSWHDAKASCENMGGHLVTIRSEAEHDFVVRLCGETRAWLGATNEDTAGNWVWVSGRSLVFPRWASPSISRSPGEHYLTMRKGAWSDHPVRGSTVTGYVCEWE